MTHPEIATILARNKHVFISLLENETPGKYLWRPQPEKWCLLEILCHLYDEEREDFRARIHSTLQDSSAPWASIDPQGWVQERKYLEMNYAEVLNAFASERDASVNYLRSLGNADWNATYQHPKLGAMTAGMLLHNWLAHDILHIRQINTLNYLYLKAHATEPLDYAGTW